MTSTMTGASATSTSTTATTRERSSRSRFEARKRDEGLASTWSAASETIGAVTLGPACSRTPSCPDVVAHAELTVVEDLGAESGAVQQRFAHADEPHELLQVRTWLRQ